MFATSQTLLLPVPPLTADPFALVVEQPMRSYSKFPLLLQESWMHTTPSESQLDSHLSLVTVILVLALVMELM